jgi:hypothetical protein
MVYGSAVDEASGGIDLFWVPFSCFIQTHGGYRPSLGVRQVKKGRFSVAYGYLERPKHPASTGNSARNIVICFNERCPSHSATFMSLLTCCVKKRKKFVVCGKHSTCISGVGGVRGATAKRSIIPLSKCYDQSWRASDTYLFPMS